MIREIASLSLVTGCAVPELGIRAAPPSSTTTTTPGTTPTTSSTSTTQSTSTSTTSTTTDTTITTTGEPPDGIDISHWNTVVDWDAVAAAGIGFSIAKVSEGTYYLDDTFDASNQAAADVGLVRGGYHFAIPDDSSGTEQADFFVDNGGGWVDDGQTLPGALDIEWNPNWSDDCYGLSTSEMQDWIAEFLDRYAERTGRDPIIYTSRSWWSQCVDSAAFGSYPLWVAHYGVASPDLPDGWSAYTFWQTSGYGSVPGVQGDVDTDVYGGSPDQLWHFASEP